MSSLRRVRLWLNINRLLSQTNDDVLENCINKIMVELDGVKSVLFDLAKSLKCEQLKIMNDIICAEQRKVNSAKESANVANDPTQSEDINDKSLFLQLPNECMSHICGYCSKQSVRSFKLTSRRIAAVCLAEMDKICIGSICVHNMPNNLYRFNESIEYNRHCKSKRFYSLFEEFESKYNIPEDDQIMFQLTNYQGLRLVNPLQIRLNQIARANDAEYLIADKRKCIFWNKGSPRTFYESDKVRNEKQKILILEYFNVFEQTSVIAQVVIYEDDDKSPSKYHELLSKYIQNSFILVDGVNNDWYPSFKLHLNEITSDSKVSMYGHIGNNQLVTVGQNLVFHDIYKLTFQLNQSNSMYPNAKKFYQSIGRCTMFCSATKHLQRFLCAHNLALETTENRLDVDRMRCCVFRMSKVSSISRIKDKISRFVLNGVVQPKYIQIKNEEKINYTDCSQISYRINPCPTEMIEHEFNTEYVLRIFKPSSCPYPYYVGQDEAVSLSILYKDTFIVKEFVHYIFDTIRNCKENKLFYPQFKEFIPLLQNGANYILEPAKVLDEMYARSEYSTPFHFDERYCGDSKSFNLFLFDHNVAHRNDDCAELQIKLVSNSQVSDPIIPSLPPIIWQRKLPPLQVGDKVFCKMFSRIWYLAEIVRKNENIVRVHFIGFTHANDRNIDLANEQAMLGRADRSESNEYSLYEDVTLKIYDGTCRKGVIDGITASGQIKLFMNVRTNTKLNALSKYHRNEMINHQQNENGIMISNKFKRFIGLPLKVLINKSDKLQEVIDKYLAHSKNFIMSVYRVKAGQNNKLIPIPKKQQKSYKPCHQFIKWHPKDYILIKFKKCNNANFHIPIYPKTTVGGKELICKSKKEMTVILELLFSDKYSDNDLPEKISKQFMRNYEEYDEWNDLVDVFGDGFDVEDVVSNIVSEFGQCGIDLDEKYIFETLKRVKPIKCSGNDDC